LTHYNDNPAEDGYTTQGWIVVEQDILPGMGSPKKSAGRNHTYLRHIGLH
jgi:hypothetical protein